MAPLKTMSESPGGDDLNKFYVWLDERFQQLSHTQNEQHIRLRTEMNTGFIGLNAKFDALDSKTDAHETEIAVLKDRSERAERQGGILGAITGGATAAVVLLVKSMFKS